VEHHKCDRCALFLCTSCAQQKWYTVLCDTFLCLRLPIISRRWGHHVAFYFTNKCFVILEEPKTQMFTHLQCLFMKAMPSWLHAEISGIIPFSPSSKCSTQNMHWVIQYTFRMSVFNVCISGCIQSTEVYKFITVPVWMLLVQRGIRACLYARDVPSVYQSALRALVVLKVYCMFERTLRVKQTCICLCQKIYH
jgi:hypothetical protein